jgi:hypothetical protein
MSSQLLAEWYNGAESMSSEEPASMGDQNQKTIMARCVVCRGDIYYGDPYEYTDTGYYCERHSLPYLRARAEEYRQLVAQHETEQAPRVIE